MSTPDPGGSAAGGGQRSRRLAAIMFTDLVGYSALAHRDEALAIELLELHRGWVREILPAFGGREIETVGDAFLIEFTGALSAVECAVAIQRRFAEHNAAAPEHRMELRIGIHAGDVEHKDGKVFGDGVNIASRIHGMAKPGGICVSEDVHHAVRNRPAFQFASLGSPPLKNITTPLELFELAPSMTLAPPAVVAKATRRLPRWLPVAVAGAVLAGAIVAAATWYAQRPSPGTIPSIAVLPFENLSAEADSAFFTDGLHDTVIGHLSRVSGLKVISRTSVMGYRGKQSNLKQIARELGVTSVVEGSVQRAGNKLRVAAQLIDTETDTHLWSNEYDRELADVFAVQADIAQSVASAVHARLTPQEQARIESAPTTSSAAYDLYLRAVLVDRRAAAEAEDVHEAIRALEQALALDARFGQAHALLARLHDTLYWFGYDPSDARRARVEQHADEALRLDPKLAEAHVAKALFHYHGSRNYDAALAELEIARGLAPGDAQVQFWLGVIYRRQDRWNEALASLERATSLDPLNGGFLMDKAGTLQMMRRYADAGAAYARVGTLQPEDPLVAAAIAYHHFYATGDLGGLEQLIARLPPGFDPQCQATALRVDLAMLRRRFEDALKVAAACKEPFLPSSGAKIPLEYYAARLRWLATGRKTPPEAAVARDMLRKIVDARPELAVARMHLAFTLAVLGDHTQAIEEADRAVAALPLSRDALTGANLRRQAVEVYANAGAEDRAISELEKVLRLPNGGHIEELKLDPVWDPLRKDPRFQKLLDQHKAGKV